MTRSLVAATAAILALSLAGCASPSAPNRPPRFDSITNLEAAFVKAGAVCAGERFDTSDFDYTARDVTVCDYPGGQAVLIVFDLPAQKVRYLSQRNPGPVEHGDTWVIVPADGDLENMPTVGGYRQG